MISPSSLNSLTCLTANAKTKLAWVLKERQALCLVRGGEAALEDLEYRIVQAEEAWMSIPDWRRTKARLYLGKRIAAAVLVLEDLERDLDQKAVADAAAEHGFVVQD